ECSPLTRTLATWADPVNETSQVRATHGASTVRDVGPTLNTLRQNILGRNSFECAPAQRNCRQWHHGPVTRSDQSRARRRRRRQGSDRSAEQPSLTTESTDAGNNSADVPAVVVATNPPQSGRRRGRDADRGWRDLAGNSPSQVGVSGAMRARDVARPSVEDL